MVSVSSHVHQLNVAAALPGSSWWQMAPAQRRKQPAPTLFTRFLPGGGKLIPPDVFPASSSTLRRSSGPILCMGPARPHR